MKVLVGAFNPVIVKTDCETDGALHNTSIVQVAGLLHYMGGRNPATPGCCCMLEYEQLLSSIRLLCRCWWCHLLCRIIATSWPQQLPACCDHGRLCGQIKLSPKRVAPPNRLSITKSQVRYISSIVLRKKLYMNTIVLGRWKDAGGSLVLVLLLHT